MPTNRKSGSDNGTPTHVRRGAQGSESIRKAGSIVIHKSVKSSAGSTLTQTSNKKMPHKDNNSTKNSPNSKNLIKGLKSLGQYWDTHLTTDDVMHMTRGNE